MDAEFAEKAVRFVAGYVKSLGLLADPREVVYPLMASRFGHMLGETFMLDRLFDQSNKVLLSHAAVRQVSPDAFDALTRNCRIVWVDRLPSPTEVVRLLHEFSIAALPAAYVDNSGARLICPHNGERMLDLFYPARREGRAFPPLTVGDLPPALIELGEQVSRRINPARRPVAILHARDGRSLPLQAHNAYRDTSIENYVPMIRMLMNEGWLVIRIGDRNMPPVSIPSGELFHDATRADFPELYFVATDDFVIHCQSGPTDYTLVFDKPGLCVNSPVAFAARPDPRSLWAFKTYRRCGKAMSLSEIIESGAGEFFRTEQFAERGITLEENRPEMLVEAAREFLDLLANGGLAAPAVDEKTRQADRLLQAAKARAGLPVYMRVTDFEGNRARLAKSFIAHDPEFLP